MILFSQDYSGFERIAHLRVEAVRSTFQYLMDLIDQSYTLVGAELSKEKQQKLAFL